MGPYEEHLRIPVTDNESVHALLVRPETQTAEGLLFVFSHGFTVDGPESARHFLTLAETLRNEGHSAILFDYRGSGYSDGAFEDMTLDTEIADFDSVLDFTHREFPGYNIGVWGESLGAAVAAHTLVSRSDVAMAVLWSLSADLYRRYEKTLGEEIKRDGHVFTPSGFKVKLAFLESLKDRDTFEAIRDMRIPCLLVHGDNDPVASIELSRRAHELAPTNTVLCEIKGGNHGFEAQPRQFAEALESSITWIRAQIRP